MKVIITGTTGMVGEGVLLECLSNPKITEILSVSRRSINPNHPKLKEYIVKDFLSLKENVEILRGFDACFFCAGVSSAGMNEAEYSHLTYDTTIAFAKALSPKSQMTFIYISGAGTDSSEKGRSMWARIKGKTENDLIKLPFKNVFALRPGLMKITEGQHNPKGSQKIMSVLYPLFKLVFPNYANTVREVGKAMISVAQYGYEKNVIEVKDILALAKKE